MGLLNFIAFGVFGKAPEHDHICRCGTARIDPYQIGTHGCQRIMVIPPEDMGGDRWRVDGHEITGYTLRDQRGYSQHSCGCWSRHAGSFNSLT